MAEKEAVKPVVKYKHTPGDYGYVSGIPAGAFFTVSENPKNDFEITIASLENLKARGIITEVTNG